MNAHGFVRYRHWRFYGERGLAGAEAAVWTFGDELTVEYATETLAQYRVALAPEGRAIRAVSELRLFATRYQSPQPFLPALETVAWHPARELARYAARLRSVRVGQAPLFTLDDAVGKARAKEA